MSKWVLVVEFSDARMDGIGITQPPEVPWPDFRAFAEWIGSPGISSLQLSRVPDDPERA